MVNVFFAFSILHAHIDSDFTVCEMILNTKIYDYPFCSQFGLISHSKDDTHIIPIFSFCEEDEKGLKLKLYDYMAKQVEKSMSYEDLALVFACFVDYKRIDLMRLVTNKGKVFLEFLREFKETKPIYQPLYVYRYKKVSQIESIVFADIMHKEFMLAKENTC